jgi:hypothetical protein
MSTALPPPLTVIPAFELKTEPNPVGISPGEKAQLTVTAARKGGYDGQIDVELRNLPAQVTAPSKAIIAKGENSTTIELSASPAAPLGARGDVDALGTIALGQQRSASPPFAIKVQPPPSVITLKAEPPTLALKPGAKMKIKVTVERKNAPGPIVLSIAGLPPKVTGPDVTVPADQNSGEIELTVAATEVEPAKTEATITGKVGAIVATAKVTVQVEKLMDR